VNTPRMPRPLFRSRPHRRDRLHLGQTTGTLNATPAADWDGRVPSWPINSLDVGRAAKMDVRLSKMVPRHERAKPCSRSDAFNVFNHPYYSSVNNRMYVCPPWPAYPR